MDHVKRGLSWRASFAEHHGFAVRPWRIMYQHFMTGAMKVCRITVVAPNPSSAGHVFLLLTFFSVTPVTFWKEHPQCNILAKRIFTVLMIMSIMLLFFKMQPATLSVIGFTLSHSFSTSPRPLHQPEQAARWPAEAYTLLGLGLLCLQGWDLLPFSSLSLTSTGTMSWPVSECRPVITLSEDRDQTLVMSSPSHPQGPPTTLNRSATDRIESKDKDCNVTCLGISCSNRKITMFSKGLRYTVSLGNTWLTEKLHKTWIKHFKIK